MARELDFDGFWEGDVVYTCDNCHKTQKFRFDSKEETDYHLHKPELRELGWMSVKVNGHYGDFCCEKCRNEYIRKNTI